MFRVHVALRSEANPWGYSGMAHGNFELLWNALSPLRLFATKRNYTFMHVRAWYSRVLLYLSLYLFTNVLCVFWLRVEMNHPSDFQKNNSTIVIPSTFALGYCVYFAILRSIMDYHGYRWSISNSSLCTLIYVRGYAIYRKHRQQIQLWACYKITNPIMHGQSTVD